MFCRFCGEEIDNNSVYCKFCGKQIIDDVNENTYINDNGSYIYNQQADTDYEEAYIEDELEIEDRCEVCGKVLNDEPRIPLGTGGWMCEACDAAFRSKEMEADSEDETESEIDKDILEVINNKELYTYEKLMRTLLWLKMNKYYDFADDLEAYIKEQYDIENYTEKEEKCIVCGKTFHIRADNPSEMGYIICKECNSLFLEPKTDVEDGAEYESNIANHNILNRDIDYVNTEEIRRYVESHKKFEHIDKYDLIEYLDIVVNMEQTIYLQNRLINQMKNRYATLGIVQMFQKPNEPKDFSESNCPSIVGGLICSFIGILMCFLSKMLGHHLILLCGGCVLLVGIIITICAVVEYYNDLNTYLSKKSDYDFKLNEYAKNICNDRARMRKELLEKATLSYEIQLLQKQNNESRRKLYNIYSKDIIYPKYRNLVAICSIYEYFCSDSCTTLGEAYNRFGQEYRLDHIILQLDTIIAKLDAIKDFQYTLYSAIQETNRQMAHILESTNCVIENLQDFHGETEKLIDRISSIESNSALASYQAENIQKELRYMNRMSFLSGKYDKVFNNFPPS